MTTPKAPLIVANWKMHLDPEQSHSLAKEVVGGLLKRLLIEVVLAPSFVGLNGVKTVVRGSSVKLAAQNVSHEEEGPRTGEVAAAQLAGWVDYVIVGHSERRIHLHETDKEVGLKLAAAHEHDLKPILCVGETLQEKHDGMGIRTINDQLQSALAQIDPEEIAGTVIAYEPVWAIGTGEACSPTYAEGMIDGLRNVIKSVYGKTIASQVRFLYGGSVSSKNIDTFVRIPGIDGALVGGASLEASEFIALCRAAAAG
jgi:triosephosphate isomerase (TIM)